MPFYSVHLRGGEDESRAETAFVRQAFCWKAFFFGPAWLAFKRLWLGLALWIAAYFLLAAAAATFISAGSVTLIALALQVLLGLEASTLTEAKLARRGYQLTEIISAPALYAAEAAFYRHRMARDSLGGGEANSRSDQP